jgi:hypothetical protein
MGVRFVHREGFREGWRSVDVNRVV